MIYFVQGLVTLSVKIGFSDDVPKRFQGLQGSCSEPLDLLGTIEGDVEREHELHAQVDAERLHGEWFYVGPYVEALLGQYGFKAHIRAQPWRVRPKFHHVVNEDTHRSWHVKKGIVHPDCPFCREESRSKKKA